MIQVKVSTISWTDHPFSVNALSISPGTKKDVIDSPAPTAISWCSDFWMLVSIQPT